jgi:DNA ligase-1
MPTKPTLAKQYEGEDPTGWLMSEKLDGVRAIWDGTQFISRNGNKFHAPDWFTAQMPSMALDGELFIGRGMFQQTVGAVRSKSGDWSKIKFHVFDAPESKGDFVSRLKSAECALRGVNVAQMVDHVVCDSRSHLDSYFEEMQSVGAEGVMLRNPAMAYEQRRTNNLLKIKWADSDEATVIAHKTNAVTVDWMGVVFDLGSGFTNAIRKSLPAIGEQVSFAFCGKTDSGKPRFPTFLAVRDYE